MYTGYQPARSAIQKMARSVFFAQVQSPSCASCGYTTHVEVAHRQAVAAFPETALVREINDLSNLVGLCPTHHWEFDNIGLNI